MAALSVLASLFCTLLCFISATNGFSFEVSAQRDIADAETVTALSAIRKRQSANLPSKLGQSLYWFGNFSVGDSGPLKLLIDTGSTDCLVNPGLYKPSNHEKAYKGHKNFTITYEGVNRAGFGFETLNGSVHEDVVTAGGLTVTNQAVGNIKTYSYADTKPLPYAIQGQGIIGFASKGSSSFKPQAPSWFFNLCHNKAISECKLGLVFGTSGKGLAIIGKYAKRLITGDIITTPINPKIFGGYTVKGDVALDNKIILKDQWIIMDVGTDNIQGPIPQTKEIFKKLGYHTHEKSAGKNSFYPNAPPVKVLSGYFPCDKPPTIGFSFPAQSDLKKSRIPAKSKIFNVSPKVWDVYDHGDNNCTSIVGGTNALNYKGSTAWLLGQSFFAGHYIDFDISAHTISYADLKDPSMKSCT